MEITVGELYEKDSKKRKWLAKKHKFYRFFGYNPQLLAFQRTCAFCFTELTDDTVEGVWERSAFWDFNTRLYDEEHKCSCCKQRWSYSSGTTRGRYKFDAEIEAEMEKYKWIREENSRNIQAMVENKYKKRG